MKKLMVVAVATVIASIANAALVDWAASGLDDAYKSQTYYVFDGTKKDAVLAILGAFDAATSLNALSDLALPMADGKATGKATSKGKISAKTIDMGSATTVMGLVFAGTPADGVGYLYIVDDVSAALYTPPATGTAFASTLATAGTSGKIKGTSGDVPEPTSAMLILLGVAGLALRRKQA